MNTATQNHLNNVSPLNLIAFKNQNNKIEYCSHVGDGMPRIAMGVTTMGKFYVEFHGEVKTFTFPTQAVELYKETIKNKLPWPRS